jgi:ABC-type uncharacterized transport system permease subunit
METLWSGVVFSEKSGAFVPGFSGELMAATLCAAPAGLFHFLAPGWLDIAVQLAASVPP